MPNKNFFCLTAFIVALAELGAFFVQAASQDNTTNSYQANSANQPVPSQIQPTNQVTFSSDGTPSNTNTSLLRKNILNT